MLSCQNVPIDPGRFDGLATVCFSVVMVVMDVLWRNDGFRTFVPVILAVMCSQPRDIWICVILAAVIKVFGS